MAFISSFRVGREAVYPDSLREKLTGFPLFANVGESALRRILSEANWFGLPGGMLLDRDGENARALFLVVTGTLGVFVDDDKDGKRLVAHIPAGQTVGEMSLISGEEAHSAQLVALRDTELLRVSPESFQSLVARYPVVMMNLMRTLVKRLQDTTQNPTDQVRPKTFAIIPLHDGLGNEPIGRRLASVLVSMGSKAAVLDASSANESAEWFSKFETGHDVVFYRGDAPHSAWSQLCLRQADRILLLARANEPLPLAPLDLPAFKERASGLPQLLLLHPEQTLGLPEHFALRTGLFESHHHIRESNAEDIRRLARFISGRAIGLVLAGGGARGFAHIGVAKAMAEANVPFDNLGGTSMGAIIAACLALEWSIEKVIDVVRHAFVLTNPLSDYTIPLIALVRGKKVSTLLREGFGDVRIEEMPRPFFCVSSDLTSGRIHVHRAGPLWRALRASVALPGILPPVTYHGHLLVDGGVMNNLPVDVMKQQQSGPIIGVDVTGELDMHVGDQHYGERPIWSLIGQRMRGSPSILSILMRSGTVGSEAQRHVVRELCDYLFEPPLLGIGLRDWKKFDAAVAGGYEHAVKQMQKNGVPLTSAWSDGNAVTGPVWKTLTA